MLQVKNLTKIYHGKKGNEVRALDNVSITFPEKGMVFLLGKSGSGKSTLLNICGGLDSPTQGEIIVKGRSSKDFAQSDFDSYRNTFVGFIFQEYNILNEFSVEENIALALQLQGKSKDKKAIGELLKQVDLDGFAKRKPNTLSGGQKQRIAIARALIKSPEIIMADEPTGALDSNTGRQVFDTLKKLSQDKLVLVVSHDREFAELYGDRIIEMKDGSVISDVTKTMVPQEEITGKVRVAGNILCIKDGGNLSDRDFETIKQHLKNSSGEVMIATDDRDVENLKKVSRIGSDGSKEVFRQTEEKAAREYSKEEGKFIRSRLPLGHAVKMGVSSLKSKPVRLFFTVILCVVAFVMFALVTTLNFYDSESSFRQSMAISGDSVLKLEKEYTAYIRNFSNGEEDDGYDTIGDARFTDEEAEEYMSRLGGNGIGAVSVHHYYNVRSVVSKYWDTTIGAFAYMDDDHPLQSMIVGKYPKEDDEIVISSYAADMMIACGIYNSDGELVQLSVRDDLIGKEINVNGQTFTITGYFDSGEVDPKYQVMMDGTASNSLQMEYAEYLGDSLHLVAFSTKGRLATEKEFIGRSGNIYDEMYSTSVLKMNGEYIETDYVSTGRYKPISQIELSGDGYIAVPSASSGKNGAVISSIALGTMVRDALNTLSFEDRSENWYTERDKMYQMTEGLAYGYIWEFDENGEGVQKNLTKDELRDYAEKVLEKLEYFGIEKDIALSLFDVQNNVNVGDAHSFEIVGVIMETNYYYYSNIYIPDDAVEQLWEEQKYITPYYCIEESKYTEAKADIYDVLFVPYAYSEEVADAAWDIYSNSAFDENDVRIHFGNSSITKIEAIDSMVKSLSKIFLIVGCIMAVFAILLFANFISVSISQKQRDIGILRAVGARGNDVFKIFFAESFTIILICVIMSTIATSITCDIINSELAQGLGVSILTFGMPSVCVLVGVALATAILATFVPVFNAARKKPVETIRGL